MNQSNIIFGFLLAAFVIFITQRGELPIYLGFLLATPKNNNVTRGADLPDITTSAGTISPSTIANINNANSIQKTLGDLGSVASFLI